MATRENQGLQIALIAFVMFTVVLAVTTYVFFNRSQEAYEQADHWKKEANEARTGQQMTLDEYSKVKGMIGHPPETRFSEIEQQHKLDMTMFGENCPEENRTYKELPSFLISAIRERSGQLASAAVREISLATEKTQIRTVETRNSAKYEADQKKVAKDLADERAKFNQDRQRVTNESTQIAKQLNTQRNEFLGLDNKNKTEIQELTSDVATLTQRNININEKVQNLVKQSFESPHGKITWVNQRNSIVYINLGFRDGLRPQISFTVFDENERNVTSDQHKGILEVTKILGQHLAEARILHEDLSDPLLPGDEIYSPVWKPGRQLRFALAGFLDLDDDKRSDRKRIRNIITLNGGMIDAEVDDTGRRTGKVTIDTRYLVVGQRPTEKTSAEGIRGYTNIIGEAQELGIERISIDKLLSMMGWQGEERTLKLGSGAVPDDFRVQRDLGRDQSTGDASGLFGDPDAPVRRSTGDTSDLFRERRPPSRRPDGAF